MTEEHQVPPKLIPILAVGGLILFIAIANIIPGSWFGIKAPPSTHVRLDLNQLNSLSAFNSETQGVGEDGLIDWNQFVSSTYDGDASTSEQIQTAPLDPQAIAALNDSNNLTGSFSKNLYAASAYLDQNGITDESSQQEALSTLLAQEQSKLVATTYNYTDLKITTADTKASEKAYGNTIAPILAGIVTEQTITNDITAVQKFATTKNSSDLSSLLKNKTRLDGILQKLIAMPIPASAGTYHLLALNRIAAYKDLLDNLSKADTDPVRSLLVFQNYTDTVTLVIKIKFQLANYFDAQNIVYSAQDPGYLFTAGYTTK